MEIALGELADGFESDPFISSSDEGNFLAHVGWFYDTLGFESCDVGLFGFDLMLKGW